MGKKGNHQYQLDGNILKHVEYEKDIGVTVDHNLKFEIHMNGKSNKANTVMGVIRRTFSYLDTDMFKKLYKALIRPYLEYANPASSPSFKKNIIT